MGGRARELTLPILVCPKVAEVDLPTPLLPAEAVLVPAGDP